MDSPLTELFKREKARIFEPGPRFCQDVMTELERQLPKHRELWDAALVTAWPILAFALAFFLVAVSIQMIAPISPTQGMIESYLDTEISPTETLVYQSAEIPASPEVF